MRSSTKKQFSSSWNAYRKFTTKGWSIYAEKPVSHRANDHKTAQAHLLKQSALLYDICHCFHLHTFGFVDVLECVQFARLLVLDDADLERAG